MSHATIVTVAAIILAACVLFAQASDAAVSYITDSQTKVVVDWGHRVVIGGCESEDGCKVNYHANGNWTIRKVVP